MNWLFVCNQNKHRSPTAEKIFINKACTKSVGLYGGRIVTKKDILWADIIFVMEEHQREELVSLFGDTLLTVRLINLDVPDIYGFMQEELVTVLQQNVTRTISAFA